MTATVSRNGARAHSDGTWISLDDVGPAPSRRNWHRPIHPLHALAFVAICAVGGFIGGIGLAMLATRTILRR